MSVPELWAVKTFLKSLVSAAMSGVNEVFLEGLQLLLRVIGNEASAAQPVVHLPSATGTGVDVEDEVKAGPVLFMLPGVEGMASILEPLAKNLKYQTVCLQLGYDDMGHTIHDLAQSLLLVYITYCLSNPFTALTISAPSQRMLKLIFISEGRNSLFPIFYCLNQNYICTFCTCV
jgi:hypothetical protein